MVPKSDSLFEVAAKLRSRNARDSLLLLEVVNYELLRGVLSAPIIALNFSLCLLNPWLLPIPICLLVGSLMSPRSRWWLVFHKRQKRLRRCLEYSFRRQYGLAKQVYLEEVLAEANYVREQIIRCYFDYAGVAVGIIVLQALSNQLRDASQAARAYVDVLWSWHWLVEMKAPK